MNSEKFTKLIVDGKIHEENQAILGPVCETRDKSKTFIYAWLLGAKAAKVADIFGCSYTEAEMAIRKFETTWDMSPLNDFVNEADKKGGFHAIDGRWITLPKERHRGTILSGMLQSAEAIIMKNLVVRLFKTGSVYLVGFIHDEVQTYNPSAMSVEKLIDMLEEIRKSLGFLCPLTGEKKCGKNWYETH